MRISIFIILVLCGLVQARNAFAQTQLIASTEPLSPQEQQQKFQLPPGFEIQLVVADPDIGQPMNMNFDVAGRLWVTSSVEYPYPVQGRGVEPRQRFAGVGEPPADDRVTVLSGIGRDGKPERITQFRQDLNIPIGLLPLGSGEALVYGIPHIARHGDDDGDGIANTESVLITGYGNQDTHGMTNAFTLGLDGWVYACHGFANDSRLVGVDGSRLHLNSGNIYRFRPDGTRLEQWTWGQVNPFGLTFDPYGNLYSADCHSKPLTLLLPGAYYQSFGKPHDGLGFGPDMIDHSHGSTGICGPAWYQSDHFLEDFNNNMYLCNPVTGRVHRDRIVWQGSSPWVNSQPDFITCDDPWFRPVDLQLGPDGALYIADFYNAIIGHYEVPLEHPKRDRFRGRIWRVVYTGGGTLPDGPGDLTKLEISELLSKLDESNLSLRTLATHELVNRGESVVPLVVEAVRTENSSERLRVHAGWVLHRLGQLSDELLVELINDEQELVRTHASRMLGERKKPSEVAIKTLPTLLADVAPMVRRTALEAIAGKVSQLERSELPRLIESADAAYVESIASDGNDTHLQHAYRIAMRRLYQDKPELWTLQIDVESSLLKERQRIALTQSNPHAAGFLLEHTDIATMPPEIATHIAWNGTDEALGAILTGIKQQFASNPNLHTEQLIAVLDGRRRSQRNFRLVNEAFAWAITSLWGGDQADSAGVQHAARLAQVSGLRDYDAEFRRIVREQQPGLFHAAEYLYSCESPSAIQAIVPLLHDEATPESLRLSIARSALDTDPKRREELLVATMKSFPLPQQYPIAQRLSESKAGLIELVELVAAGHVSPLLLVDGTVRQRTQAFRDETLNARVTTLTEDLPAEDEEVAKVIAARLKFFQSTQHDIKAGGEVFQKNCANCHRIGREGSLVGPQLDGIGNRPPARLAEDLLAPNRNVDAAFRVSTIILTDGRVLTGLKRSQEKGVITFADNKGKEFQLSEETIETLSPSSVSLMPANFHTLLAEAEFGDLLAYLRSQREQK